MKTIDYKVEYGFAILTIDVKERSMNWQGLKKYFILRGFIISCRNSR